MISIIICSIDPEKFRRISRNYTRLMDHEAFEFIGIHDAKSLSEGYNRGIRQSVGSILILSHDDIEILSADFVVALKRHLEKFDIVGPTGTSKVVDGFWPRAGEPFVHGLIANPAKPTQHPARFTVTFFGLGSVASPGVTTVQGIQALDGVFLAMNRSVVDKVRFDETTFDGFHGYDVDFTYAAFLAGFRLAVHCDIAILHNSDGSFDEAWHEYNRRFLKKHASSLPSSSAPFPAQRNWLGVACQDRNDVLRCFDPEVQQELARKYAPRSAPPSTLQRILGSLRKLLTSLRI